VLSSNVTDQMLARPARTVLSPARLGYTRLRGRLALVLEMRSLPAHRSWIGVMNLPKFFYCIFARALAAASKATP